MINREDVETSQSEGRIQAALEAIWDVAYESRTDTLKLLEILRDVENLHQKIRDSLFQASLPDNRQALYVLLRDIETLGGWPYIYRMKLRELAGKLDPQEIINTAQNQPEPTPPTEKT